MNFIVDELFTLAAAMEDSSAAENGSPNHDMLASKSKFRALLNKTTDIELLSVYKFQSSTPQHSRSCLSLNLVCYASTTSDSSAVSAPKSRSNGPKTRHGAN